MHDTTQQLVRSRVQLGRSVISYERGGNGPPLVLVHGLSGSTRWWRKNVPAFVAQFEVFVVDLAGFGGSRGNPFALAAASAMLAAWLDALKLAQVNLVGHSMGGYIAADLAATEAARIDRLILVDAAVLPFGRTYVQHGFGLLRELAHLPPAFVPVLIGDALRAGPFTLWGAAQEIMRADLREQLPNIHAPTLIVWGARDDVVPLPLGQALAALLPTSQFAVIEHAGHNAMWDCPAGFNQAVLQFLVGDAVVEKRQPCY